ncbi:hypothetical protein SAMN02745687_00787 [Lachnospiraceae bacterium NK3A20]|nr:hypothetical protein SAMN02745687_00787 [Lachnospiraceae bacterium NK3A20]
MLRFLKENRIFARLAAVNLVSRIGDRLFYTAMLALAASLPNANLAVMIVSISETLPILVSLFSGVIADRQSHKIRHLIYSSLFRALMYGGIGVLMGYPLTLLLMVAASLLNLLSDVSGNYGSALLSPFNKVLVRPEDMKKAQGLVSLGTQLVTVAATFVGATLLSFCTEKSLAMINASVFLIVAVLYRLIQPSLSRQEAGIITAVKPGTLSTVRDNLRSLFSDRVLLLNLIQLALLNGFFGGLIPVFTLFIEHNSELGSLGAPVKISLLSGMITVFTIIGNSMTSIVLRERSISQISVFADAMILLAGAGFWLNRIWIIFLSVSCLSFLLGLISPRFSAGVVNRYPTDRIGGIITAVNAFLVLAPPVTSLLFPLLATIRMSMAYLGLIVYALLLLGMSAVMARP